MNRILFACLFMLSSDPVSGQSLCDQAMPTGVTINPARIYVRMPEFEIIELDGQPRVNAILFGLWPEGGATTQPPSQGPTTIPRASIQAVTGDAGCYMIPTVPSIPSAVKLQAAIQSQRTARGTVPAAVGPWSALSGSFGAVPSALAATGRPNLRQ